MQYTVNVTNSTVLIFRNGNPLTLRFLNNVSMKRSKTDGIIGKDSTKKSKFCATLFNNLSSKKASIVQSQSRREPIPKLLKFPPINFKKNGKLK